MARVNNIFNHIFNLLIIKSILQSQEYDLHLELTDNSFFFYTYKCMINDNLK